MKNYIFMKHMNHKGITLIELVVVFVIIAIGAVLLAPNIGAWLPNYRLRSATRDIVSTMRVAQMKAVSSNVQYRVTFNADSTYVIQYQTTAGLKDDGSAQALPSGITFDPSGSIVPPGNVVFNPNATASS